MKPTFECKKGFYPIKSLDGKNNFKPHFRIEQDGKVTQSIFLNVPNPRLREEIICTHFLRSYSTWVLKEKTEIRVLNRDNPWDFELNIGGNENINIEIVSIADNSQLFINNKREEMLDSSSNSEKIPLSLLKKINKAMPDTNADKIIKELDASGAKKNVLAMNPWNHKEKRVILSYMPATENSLFELIAEALASKVRKKHADKDRTIVIIDNRTSAFNIDDFHDAGEKLDDLENQSLFMEIWFYTGYYSDDNGDNAEWSLVPISVPLDVEEAIVHSINKGKLQQDENGMVFGEM